MAKQKYDSLFDEAVATSDNETDTTIGYKLGKEAMTVRNWRKQRTQPDVGVALAICKIMKRKPEELWGDRMPELIGV